MYYYCLHQTATDTIQQLPSALRVNKGDRDTLGRDGEEPITHCGRCDSNDALLVPLNRIRSFPETLVSRGCSFGIHT